MSVNPTNWQSHGPNVRISREWGARAVLIGLGLALAFLALPAAAGPGVWRFEGLGRLYFECLAAEGDAAAYEGASYGREIAQLLPPALAEGEQPALEPRVVTDLDGPIHDGLEVRDLPLPGLEPDGAVILRQVVDGTHPRLKEQYWALYTGGARSGVWFFTTFTSRREESGEPVGAKLLAPFLIRELVSHRDGVLILRTAGSVSRPQGAGWEHGVDLVFAVSDRALDYRYAVRRYSFTFGYDLGRGRSCRAGVEEARLEDGRTVLVRRIRDGVLAPELAESCGIDPMYGVPIGDFERKVEIATCLATSPGSRILRRRPEEPSFIERGGQRELTP